MNFINRVFIFCRNHFIHGTFRKIIKKYKFSTRLSKGLCRFLFFSKTNNRKPIFKNSLTKSSVITITSNYHKAIINLLIKQIHRIYNEEYI